MHRIFCCSAWASSSPGERGQLSGCGAWASPRGGFCPCGLQALGAWPSEAAAPSLSRCVHGLSCSVALGLKPMSPALAGGFLSTVLPGKSRNLVFVVVYSNEFYSIIYIQRNASVLNVKFGEF